ncbi:MAG: thioredoxin domain-containing protein [Gemmatimonadota bacterium]|jgi:uncharacterized protein YyaL (SSP411 family)
MANRLAGETSPYLLQHAHNPVDWYPWGPEALERARAEDRPILLSIGYSACHWCHVMERESFEDEGVAALMNESFVNVKVDREERPDVDALYMRAIQALTGRGGWPLTAFLTPDGEPYYGGTYFPPEPRRGMPSFPQVLRAARQAWEDRRDEVARSASEIRSLLRRSMTERPGDDDALDAPALVEHARRFLAERFDPSQGGFGPAPKFPQPSTLEFLLRHHRATGNEQALSMVHHTLLRMARGGIRDHVGGGFHRYSVDARWLVPHFEKMLYDNALLARLYVQAWQATGDDELREAAESTLDWLLEDMRVSGDGGSAGGFYAARDADSEGEEGLFYLWTPEQVRAVLDDGDARLFMSVYDVTEPGNFEGCSIPHLPHGLDAAARGRGMEPATLRERMAGVRRALAQARTRREPPLRDEKVLAGWNGMAVRAFAEAGGALDRDDYVEAARSAMTWLLDVLRPHGPDGGLLHVWTAGRARIPAFLEDVAALGNAALTLHEVSLEPRWRDEARRLAHRAVSDFWDEDEGVFYDTRAGGREPAESLIVRPRETMDNATPSGTSLAIELCLRAGHLLGDEEMTARGRRALRAEAGAMGRYPSAFGRMLSLVQGELELPVELALVGPPDDPATRALLAVVLRRYVPGRTVTGHDPDRGPAPRVPLLEGRGTLEGRPAAYLCRSYACLRPVAEPEALESLLEEALAAE